MREMLGGLSPQTAFRTGSKLKENGYNLMIKKELDTV